MHTHNPGILEVCGSSVNMKKIREVTFKGLSRALIEPGKSLRRSDGGNVLAKARGTLFKLDGPSPGQSGKCSTWKQAPLGSKLHLKSLVWPSLEDERIIIAATHAHTQSWDFGGVWVFC